ncbi:DUF6474 family protein [Tomitella fengzijianii]|uniref:Uncharacterized protein n=1 Tax=Tomitella fengzijianii TaxID=2597660 RepID=A0A516X004_9ACTN|nr:DUF6474 family protein [Tomitella fengzijianii]QDQ96317.1 hypothetical protein FO059_01850 [Tomitella fengzijianii]
MGLLKKNRSSRRSRRKAEAAALKHKAGLEAKLSAKNGRKRDRAALKLERKRAKSQHKEDKADRKASAADQKNRLKVAEAEKANAEAGRFDAKSVGRYLSVARVLAPVVVPLAYRGATALRGALDKRRADSLGVSVDELGEFSGSGAKLGARVTGAGRTLDKLVERNPRDAETAEFAKAMRARLTDLGAAVDAAESMPGERRRSAHSAISDELDAIDADILARLGVK